MKIVACAPGPYGVIPDLLCEMPPNYLHQCLTLIGFIYQAKQVFKGNVLPGLALGTPDSSMKSHLILYIF